MKYLFALVLSLTAGMLPTPSEAKIGNGYHPDMLIDRHWYYERPSVPSDAQRSPDMLPWIPIMQNNNADVFDSFAGQRNIYEREDMFQNVRLKRLTYHPLVIDP